MRSRLFWILLLVAVAGLWHWSHWYRPRERPGAPSPDTPAGVVYFESDLPYRAWVPYPHQNLARLEQAIGDVERFSGAVARLSGRDLPRLPSFGSARVPPSSELAVATDEDGERFIAVARVYPVAGLLARWAGRLAGNPLLAGGAAEIDGRPVSVSWNEGSWVVASRGVSSPSASRRDRPPSALAWTQLGIARGYLPAGEYRLQRVGAALEFVGGDERAVERLREIDSRRPPVPLALVELAPSGRRLAGRAMALLPGVESLAGLPGAVTLHRGSRRWRVPGERLLRLVRDRPPTIEVDGWTVVALEEGSLRRGAPLGRFLNALDGSSVSIGVWIELKQARRLVDQVVEALEAVPVVGRREARRWRALGVVLAPLAGSGWLTAMISEQPAAVRVRLGGESRAAGD